MTGARIDAEFKKLFIKTWKAMRKDNPREVNSRMSELTGESASAIQARASRLRLVEKKDIPRCELGRLSRLARREQEKRDLQQKRGKKK